MLQDAMLGPGTINGNTGMYGALPNEPFLDESAQRRPAGGLAGAEMEMGMGTGMGTGMGMGMMNGAGSFGGEGNPGGHHCCSYSEVWPANQRRRTAQTEE